MQWHLFFALGGSRNNPAFTPEPRHSPSESARYVLRQLSLRNHGFRLPRPWNRANFGVLFLTKLISAERLFDFGVRILRVSYENLSIGARVISKGHDFE